MSAATRTVAAGIKQHSLLSPADRVLVAFSGGADSTALAVVLIELGYELVLGHVDHGMRPDSAADAHHCAAVAEALGLPLRSTRVRVEPPTQAEARRVRYEALDRLAKDSSATMIATGHTLDDQAETVELRLRRGGLGLGIPPRRGNIVRPILDLRRSQTEEICREAGLIYIDDPSNRNHRYARVRVRNELVKAGEERMHELIATAEDATVQVRLVQESVDQLWDEIVRLEQEPKAAYIRRAALATLDSGVAGQLVRRSIREFGLEPTGRVIDDILIKVAPATGARLSLGQGLWAWSEPRDLVVGRWSMPRTLPLLPIRRPGVTRSQEWGLECRVEEIRTPAAFATTPWEELLDAAAVDGPLSIRAWMPGDRFHPLGARGTKKLQDFFVDEGVPRRHRWRVPILQAGDRIVWVVGHRIDERFKLSDASSTALRVRVTPMTERV